jgi:transposase-like protein
MIRAVEKVFPRALRQRCLAHETHNLEAKVPEEAWREVKREALVAYQTGRQPQARANGQGGIRRTL